MVRFMFSEILDVFDVFVTDYAHDLEAAGAADREWGGVGGGEAPPQEKVLTFFCLSELAWVAVEVPN